MRRAAAGLALLAILATAASTACAGPPPKVHPSGDPPTRALFVGNSYLYYEGGVPNHVARMAEAAGLTSFEATAKTIGDGRLDQHDIEAYLADGSGYDIVILQEHSSSSLTPANRARFRTAANAAAEAASAAGAALAFYLTHAYAPPHPRADPAQIQGLEKLYLTIANDLGGLVAPVGLAFETAYETRPGIGLQDARDGSHPTILGVYLAAATVFATLFDSSPVGNAYRMNGAIDDATALFLQTAARDTVEAFFGRASPTN